MSNAPARVALRDVQFAFRAATNVIDVENFDVQAHERVFIQGPSGSGKSTLLGLIGGVLLARRGSVSVMGVDLGALKPAARDRFRAEHIGFIFQQFNLLPYLNVLDNVTLPLNFARERRRRTLAKYATTEAAARELLKSLDLTDPSLLKRHVNELSVGQQQRVAVARALIGGPELIIADEPTSALDSDARERFLQLLFNACEQSASTLLFVSHDYSLKSHFNRQLNLGDINRCAA